MGTKHHIRGITGAALLAACLALAPAASPRLPTMMILNVENKNVSSREEQTFNRVMRMAVVQSQRFLVLSYEDMENRLKQQNQSIPAACFNVTCIKAMGSFVNDAKFILSARISKKRHTYITDYRIINNYSGKQVSYLTTKSDLLHTDMTAFVRQSVAKLLGLSATAEVEVDTAHYRENNIWQLLAATSLLTAAGYFTASEWGPLKRTDDNSLRIRSLASYPDDGFSSLRGFYALPFIAAEYQSMGGAGVAAVNDGNAVMLNPAGLAQLEQEWANFTQSVLPGEVPSYYLGYAAPLAENLFQAAGLRYLGDELAGEMTCYLSLATDLAPWFKYIQKLRMGVNLKAYFLSVGSGGVGLDRSTGHGYGWAVDVGFQFPFTSKIEGGIFLRDVYSYLYQYNTLTDHGYDNESLPSQFTVGFIYRVNSSIIFVIDGEKALWRDQVDHVRLGASKKMFRLLHLRLGTSQVFSRENSRRINLGFGLNGDVEDHSLHVNYSYGFGTEKTTSLDNIHQFSLELGF